MSAIAAVRPTSTQATSSTPASYTVVHGDTLSGIAARFGVSLSALEAANPRINPNRIYSGDRLTIPGGHDSAPVAGGKGGPASGFTTSENGVKLIEGFEGGPYLNAYPDPATGGAPWTIGYGHTGGVTPGEHITQAQAEQFLKDDLKSAENAVRNSIHVPITQNQFDACVSLAFNIGGGGFANSDVAARINAGNYSGAQQAFGEYNHANGKVLEGLTRRRAAEAALFGSSAPSGTGGGTTPTPTPKPTTGGSGGAVTVHAGDTLSSIASSHHVSLA
ncbi:MAG TPA: glycoside hydrolase family protein, partial [Rhodanobacter sp.]|nr:glycoside hydrolase family protein [Rhodanobacter sp.]